MIWLPRRPAPPRKFLMKALLAVAPRALFPLSMLALLGGCAGLPWLQAGVHAETACTALMAPVLGWSDEQQRKEIEHYLARVEAERASQQQPDDETADSARMGAPEIVPLA